MAYTLISSVGTGMYKDGYRETVYSFPSGEKVKTHIFLNALLENKYRDISKIILVGTVTSGWDMLIDVEDELWLKVCEAKENNAINQDIISKIETYLSNKLNISTIIKCHTDKIENDTSEEIFKLYSSIIPEIADENILFDITHGFRSMPILLYQALQFSISHNPKIQNVELVYGEYIESKKESYVRDLSNYWKYSQISDALNVFREKLDGFKLAELISSDWDAGAKAVKRFSEIVQTNFSLQISEVAKQIKNAINNFPEDKSVLLNDIKDFLADIYKCISKDTVHESLYSFSKFLYKRKLNVQAVITLQVTVEAFIAETNNHAEMIGNYDWWQDEGRTILNKIKSNNWKEIGGPLSNLESFRNQIAHGGGTNKDGNFPQAANIPNIYKSGSRGVENLFNIR